MSFLPMMCPLVFAVLEATLTWDLRGPPQRTAGCPDAKNCAKALLEGSPA
jgi:hypothetical protein